MEGRISFPQGREGGIYGIAFGPIFIPLQCEKRTYNGHAHVGANLLQLLREVPERVLADSPLRGKAGDGPLLKQSG